MHFKVTEDRRVGSVIIAATPDPVMTTHPVKLFAEPPMCAILASDT